jgi:transketolase
MRNLVAALLHSQMIIDSNIYIITADLGYGLWDEIKKDFPDRFYNVGSAEQLMLGIGVGLALSGKIPICYSISPFLLYRPAEFIKNYLIHENIPVKLIGAGRDRDYGTDGFTHWEAPLFNEIMIRPTWTGEVTSYFNYFIYSKKPLYMNLRK